MPVTMTRPEESKIVFTARAKTSASSARSACFERGDPLAFRRERTERGGRRRA